MGGRWGLWGLAGVLLLWGCVDRERSSLVTGQLAVSPAGVDFRRVAMFDGREVELSLRNIGRAQLGVEEAWVEGPEGAYIARFSREGPHFLNPGGETQLRVRFAPLAAGQVPATLVIRTDARREPITRVPLSGMGVDAAARVAPRRLDFGRIEADSSKTLTLTLTNPTDIPVEVTPRLVGADRDEFALEPVTLGPNEERAVPVTFSPGRVGRKQVALTLTPCRGCADLAVEVAAEALERAVIAEPDPVEFGGVPLDRFRLRTLTLRNISTEPMTVTGMSREGRDAGFTHPEGGFPFVLGPGEGRPFELRFSPGHMGEAEDTLHYTVESRRNPRTAVQLRGRGGAAEICISPLTHDYGTRPVGSKTTMQLNVKNCGSGDGGPLVLFELALVDNAPGGARAFSLAPLTLPRALLPGEEFNLKVFFEPTEPGPATAVLVVRSDAFNSEETRVLLGGIAQQHAPCEVAITPAALDFGTVPPRQVGNLGVKVANRGRDLCAVKNIRLSDNGGGLFRMPGGEIDGLVMFPGDFFSFMVAFDSPVGGGTFSGELQIEAADPADPRRLVPLVANSQPACLVATPRFLDWGVVRQNCPPTEREVNFVNACPAPLTVADVSVGPGTTDGEFTLVGGPRTLPLPLAPGEGFTARVTYRAQPFGLNLSPLYVASSDLRAPLLVPLLGEKSSREERTDVFTQTDVTKADVLFVVDNTASMVEEQPKLVAGMPAFARAALERGVDLHVAVTTTGIDPVNTLCPGGAQGGEAGRFFPADGSSARVLTHRASDLAGALQRNAQVGQCALVEQGFEAMRRALSPPLFNSADDPRTPLLPNDGNLGFLRDEASLAVVFVGDEDDHSPDAVQTYVGFLRARKGENQPQRVALYAIAPTGSACATSGSAGRRYAEAAALTGGEVLSVCASDYGALLERVASRAFSPQDRFPLARPAVSGSLRVRVNGVERTSGWTHDEAANAVVFAQQPPPGARIEVTYRLACD